MPLFLCLKLRGIIPFVVEKMALVQILLLLFPFSKSSQTDFLQWDLVRKKENYEQKKQQRKKKEREEGGLL